MAVETVLVPYCVGCNAINDTGLPCIFCGEIEIVQEMVVFS